MPDEPDIPPGPPRIPPGPPRRPPGPPPGTHSRLGRSLAGWVREAREAVLDDESIESLLRVSLHAAAEEVPLRTIAEAVGEALGVPTRSITAEEAGAHFGWFGPFAGIDNPTSSTLTRERLGWRPREVGLLEDIRATELAPAG